MGIESSCPLAGISGEVGGGGGDGTSCKLKRLNPSPSIEYEVVVMVDEPRTEEELAALDEAVDADVSKVEGVADKAPEEEATAEKK